MPRPTIDIKRRRIPTSSSMAPDEIQEVQEAARIRRVTMSEFMRQSALREARRVNRKAEQRAASAA